MTPTVDEAREALLADPEYEGDLVPKVDALIAAVRAETRAERIELARLNGEIGIELVDAEAKLAALREADVHDLASALYETDPPESWMRTGTDEYRKRAAAMLVILERERALAATPAEEWARWIDDERRILTISTPAAGWNHEQDGNATWFRRHRRATGGEG